MSLLYYKMSRNGDYIYLQYVEAIGMTVNQKTSKTPNLLKNIKSLAAVSIDVHPPLVALARVFLFCPAHTLADS